VPPSPNIFEAFNPSRASDAISHYDLKARAWCEARLNCLLRGRLCSRLVIKINSTCKADPQQVRTS